MKIRIKSKDEIDRMIAEGKVKVEKRGDRCVYVIRATSSGCIWSTDAGEILTVEHLDEDDKQAPYFCGARSGWVNVAFVAEVIDDEPIPFNTPVYVSDTSPEEAYEKKRERVYFGFIDGQHWTRAISDGVIAYQQKFVVPIKPDVNARKMTVKEIADALGHPVEIVEG